MPFSNPPFELESTLNDLKIIVVRGWKTASIRLGGLQRSEQRFRPSRRRKGAPNRNRLLPALRNQCPVSPDIHTLVRQNQQPVKVASAGRPPPVSSRFLILPRRPLERSRIPSVR